MVQANSTAGVDPRTVQIERLVDEGLIDMKTVARVYSNTTSKATPVRHATRGILLLNGSRLRLEAIMIGGKLMTSRAAVLRFFTAQNETDTATSPQPAPRSPAARNKAATKAGKELDALGVK